MINKDFFYAVVGASTNEEKHGYKVFKDLLDAGYKVVPINPNEKEILGEKVYPTLSEVKKTIDVVIFVTPPTVTEKVLEEVVTISDKIDSLQKALASKIELKLQDLIKTAKSKTEIIVTFLALLELIKQKILTVEQEAMFSDIIIKKRI